MSPGGLTVGRNAIDLPAAPHAARSQRADAAARRVIVFVDDSPEATNAAWRAALVARDRGLPLHLVALQPLHARLDQAARLLDVLAREVHGKLGLLVTSQAIAGSREHEGVEIARSASLLVLPASGPRAGWPPGSPVLRMLRETGRPVLAVRLPAYASYRRVLVAVKQDFESRALVAAAHALSRDPGMKVLHVIDTRHEQAMRLADVPERTIRARREGDAERTRAVLVDLIASAGAGGEGGAVPVVDFGHAADRVIEHELATSADLLVAGKRPRHPLVDTLRGGVPQRVLRDAGADVLLVPLAPRT
jgi:nucleotide-binding universal stress UspA family protein